jgi:hypothetical protein
MTSTASRTANKTANPAVPQLTAPPARTTVAASGGSLTTSREPAGAATVKDAGKNHKPGVSGTPAAEAEKFAAVSMATRIQELAKWIAARPSFTFAEAAAASAPSPCSLTVMAYTLPDARLASALTKLGCVVTAGGKNGYTVTAIKVPA